MYFDNESAPVQQSSNMPLSKNSKQEDQYSNKVSGLHFVPLAFLQRVFKR